MAEIEKKYSDFQKSECETLDFPSGSLSEELCPTCQPNPNFILENNWWEIEDAYLNEKFCEYHVRVFKNEKAVEKSKSDEPILFVGATRILEDLNKPLNDTTRNQVMQSLTIKDVYSNLDTIALGEAYLLSIPAFNFDQIPSNDDENSELDENSRGSNTSEIIISTEGLYRKLKQIEYALKTYNIYYRLTQSEGGNFVIRRAGDETSRINFEATIKSLKLFIRELNEALKDSKFAKINRTGLFKSKRANSLKFVFNEEAGDYVLKFLYALPNDGCGRYEKIKVKKSNPLRKPRMKVIYNFLNNLEQVINDIF